MTTTAVMEKETDEIAKTTNTDNLPLHIQRKAVIIKELLGEEIGSSLVETFLKSKIIFSPREQLRTLCEKIKEGLLGKTITLTGVICPDYSYEETGNENVPYRYTFESVSDGVGVVAMQVARITPALVEFLNRYGIKTEVKLFIADFESNSEAILKKMGVTKTEFVKRCEKSLKAFKKSLNGTPNVTLQCFEKDWHKKGLKEYTEAAYEKLSQGNYLNIRKFAGKKPQEAIKMFVKSSQEFYKEWHGSQVDVRDIVIRQASEYAAVGRIIMERFQNETIIQVAGDRQQMNFFANMYSPHAIVCAEKSY